MTTTIDEPGELAVLNCGAGHLKFTFDIDDEAEVKKAKKILADMRKRGYAIFVWDAGAKSHKKVKGFDLEKSVYYIEEAGKSPVDKRRRSCKSIPMKNVKAIAIAPGRGG